VHTLEENTTLVGITELRSKMGAVLKALKHSKVLLEIRNQPFAVLVSLEQYKKMEEMLEILEDKVLGYFISKRKKTKEKSYLTLDEVEKKFGLR
jgi:prevent-host-death family protein